MNRRDLLKLLGTGAALPAALIGHTATADGRRIILVELAGANDGLNTVVPWRNDQYHKLRPTLALQERQLIRLTEDFAVHQALEPLMPLWQAGELAVLHGLGYPKPNRSHFKSMALWESGGDGNGEGRQGWITHDLEHQCAQRELDACGISLGGRMGVFDNANGSWLSMSSLHQYADTRIATDPGAAQSANPLLQMLANRATLLERSVDAIARKVADSRTVKFRSANKFESQVGNAAGLIAAGVNAPVLKLTLNGFDTHKNQAPRHRRLLASLAQSITRLRRELIEMGEWRNTLIITYSEFGRTTAENANGGTDHGTVAPHFVFGGAVNGGFYGEHPEIPAAAELDMTYSMDYRALYSALLSQWLQTPTNHFQHWRDARLQALV